MYLTETEKLALEKRYTECSNAKESDGIKALLLRSEERTVCMIEQALRLHESTIAICNKSLTVIDYSYLNN